MAEPQTDIVELHLDPERLDEVDAIARATERDRHGVVADALAAYLELHRRHVAHIREGLRQAEAGEFASEEEVARVFRRQH